MIVNLQNEGWEIIYHRAHALLAAQVAGQWDFAEKHHRIYETIAAISHHDDLEKEWEHDLLTEAGAPMDFTLDRKNSVEKLIKHADDGLYHGRWVAMLISMHLCFLNQSEENKEIKAFLEEQRQRQQTWREELGISEAQANSAYNFMRWCDRFSLILCQRQIPDGNRKLEITTGPDGQEYCIFQASEDNVGVSPWPFTRDSFTVSVDACYLNQLHFDSNDELKDALKNAPRKALIWTIQKCE